MQTILELQNVVKNYGRTPVLGGVSMEVKEGEIISVLGPSGCGKSTLLRIIAGILPLDQGLVRIRGREVSDKRRTLPPEKRGINMVFQDFALWPHMKVEDNITYGLEHVSEEQIAQAVEAANLSEVIKRLPQGLDTMIEEHGANLSGGQRQRISIARALIRNPQVIILDEATSALDSISESEIQEALERLTKGRTTFIVAHRLSTVRGADRILVIGQGRIREQGSYQELMAKKGEFYQMEQLQRMVR